MASTGKSPGQHCGWCRRALGLGPQAAAPKGARLVLAAVGVFLAPLVLGLIGAAALSPWGTGGMVLGGVGGFALGLLSVAGFRRWTVRVARRRRGMSSPDHDDLVTP